MLSGFDDPEIVGKAIEQAFGGHAVDPNTVPDIIDDYLGEVYGPQWKKRRGLRRFWPGKAKK